MDFNKQKPIYLQISDTMSQRIMAGEWAVDERIPSVREVAGSLGVNPNTVMRTFDHLQQSGIIYNRRGVGYFVSADAKERILDLNRQHFITEELPYFFQRMKLLGITIDDLRQLQDD